MGLRSYLRGDDLREDTEGRALPRPENQYPLALPYGGGLVRSTT